MPEKNNLKVSINSTEEKSEAPGESSVVMKKKAAKKSVSAKTQKPASKKTATKSKKTVKKKEKRGFLSVLFSILITALIVGGGIYAWQSKTGIEKLEKAETETTSIKKEFEKRLEILKNKLTGVETENVELKVETEKLKEQEALLNKAKLEYSNIDNNFSFMYPAVFGEVSFATSSIATGTKFMGAFSKNDKLSFNGISQDYFFKSTSTKADLSDFKEYAKRRRVYYFLGPGDLEIKIEPIEIIEIDNGEALLIDKSSFDFNSEDEAPPVNVGENMAALINLDDNKEYKGLILINKDLDILPEESFKNIIKSFEIIK